MTFARLLLPFLALLACCVSCTAPPEAPGRPAGEVTRTLRAPLDRTWREAVAAVHQTGVVVPHDQRPGESTGTIETDVLRVDLIWLTGGEETEVRVLYNDDDALRARVRGESLLNSIEDRLDRR